MTVETLESLRKIKPGMRMRIQHTTTGFRHVADVTEVEDGYANVEYTTAGETRKLAISTRTGRSAMQQWFVQSVL